MNVLLIVVTALILVQQGDPVIDWLTSLQSMQARLQETSGESDRDSAQIAGEISSLQMEIASWSAAQTDGGVAASPPPEGASRERLTGYVTELRQALEQYERRKQAGRTAYVNLRYRF
jgi:hypothetical protein